MSKKIYECTVSFTFETDSPTEAANEFIANIQNNPNWYVNVRNVETNDRFTVDTETGECEED
jgi:hypothetical protein